MKRNITDLITENGSLLNSILAAMPDGLLILNASNQIIKANESAGKLLGWSSGDDLIGKSFSDVYSNADEMENFLGTLFKNKSLNNYISTLLKANGQTFVASCSALLDFSDINQDRRVIILRDVTGHLDTIEKLSKSEEYSRKVTDEFDKFLYIVSHDLKAPLRAISNLSEWIQEDLEPTIGKETEYNLKLLRSRVNRLEAMISGLSRYAKVNNHKEDARLVDVSALIQDVLKQHPDIPSIRIDVGQMPSLLTSKTALETVFINLIENAIQFNNKRERCISIQSWDRGDLCEFTIEDNGPGIGPEYREKVFNLFHTLQPKDQTESTGIGLALVKRIVGENGGEILIKESGMGGCSVIFTWPKK